MNRALVTFFRSPWSILIVLVVALALRLIGIDQWSLWQDEETSIYFSQRPDRSFARAHPLFFGLLGLIYEVTGISVAVGRALTAAFGVLGIWLTYVLCRKYADRQVALVAALLLSVCLGHVFWSQSIRYYTFVAAAEVLAMILVLDGFEKNQVWKLFTAGVLVAAAMLIHFTAVLMLPVVVGYLMLVFMFNESDGRYGWKGMLALMPSMLIGFAVLLPVFIGLLGDGSMGPKPYVQPPSHFLLRYVAYFGVPMFGLALLSPLVIPQFSRRTFFIFFSLGVIPILEILVIGGFKLSITAWYHALVAVYGFAGLAALTLVGGWRAGYRKTVAVAGVGSAAYYALFLGLYYTVMCGDRARWEEGTQFVQQAAAIDVASASNPVIYATVPEIVHFYLGVPPGQTKESSVAWFAPKTPDNFKPHLEQAAEGRDQWFLIEAWHVTPSMARWFEQNCTLVARFPAGTTWRDRTLLIYHKPADDRERQAQRRPAQRPLTVANAPSP